MSVMNLVEYLKRCDDAYYNSSNPLVSDATYDALIETLRKLDPSNEYLQKVGARVRSNKVGRLIPMGTLSKYHKDEEILKWLNQEKGIILLSPKYDGFAVELIYDKGNLIAASTRGDGNVGEDVLAAMMRVKSVPISLEKYRADLTIVRGEAIIPRKNHDKIKELGYTAMRNAVPGIVRSNRADALMYVDYVAYEFIDGSDNRIEQREYYASQFIVEDARWAHYDDFDTILARRAELRDIEYKYELDGVVLKTNEIIFDDDLLHPRHMIAWKYKSNRETTVLRDVEYQMGLTGYFTPIGIFDEVEFQGAKLSRASLGNITRMEKEFKGMTIGSLIEVSRRGDIIPYIEELAFIEDSGKLVEYPTRCPHCGELLAIDTEINEETKEVMKCEPHCVNKSCPELLRLQISQYARAVGIKGIGDKLIRVLIDGGYIKSILDIYYINPEVILSIPRQGQSAVDKWKSLQEKRLSSVELLTAYPFLDLGRKIWETMLTKFDYHDIVYHISEDLIRSAKLKGIGDSKISSIVTQVSANSEELIELGKIHGLI